MIGIRLALTVAVGKALELAELAQHLARRAQINLRPQRLHQRARAFLVRGIGIRVHEADRDRFDFLRFQQLDSAAHIVFRQRRHHRAIVRDAFAAPPTGSRAPPAASAWEYRD